MESIAMKCKVLQMCFAAEEFIGLRMLPFSDCLAIDCWHASTVFDIIEFIRSQGSKNVSVELMIDYVKKSFLTEKKWEKLMRDYWDKAKSFIQGRFFDLVPIDA